MSLESQKSSTKRYKSYSDADMQKAILEINGGVSIKKAAERFNINRTTLMNHVKGFKCNKVGRPTVLTKEEEELLVHSLVKLGEWGYGFDRMQLRLAVKDFCTRMDRVNPFKDGFPGNDWCAAFEKRWKQQISNRVAQNLPKNRAMAGHPDILMDFYTKLNDIMTKLDITNKPQNVYNCDETGFQTDAGKQRVLCKRGSKNPNKLVGSVTKASYTVLTCCNAIGDFLPLFINYKGLHLYSTWCVNGPNNARYNCSPSGWMESPQFLDWFLNCFVPATSKQEGNKLLIYDGHNSHISIELIETAVKNNITLLCLPAHTSHLVQPLDVGVFKAVKQSWRKILQQYYHETAYKNVDKIAFPNLMKKLCDSGCFSRANALGGFEGSGIYPLSKEKLLSKAQQVVQIPEATEMDTSLPNGVATTSESVKDTDVSPKTALELSLLSVLRSKENNAGARAKKSRISRRFAESLTEDAVIEKLRNAQRDKENKKGGTNNKNVSQRKKNPKQTKRARKLSSSSESESDITVTLESEYEQEDFDELNESILEIGESIENDNNMNQETNDTHQSGSPDLLIREGNWVIAKYGNSHYVAKVLKTDDQEIKIQFLRKKELYFVYPDIEDILSFPKNDILKLIDDPLIQRGKHYFKITDFPPGLIFC